MTEEDELRKEFIKMMEDKKKVEWKESKERYYIFKPYSKDVGVITFQSLEKAKEFLRKDMGSSNISQTIFKPIGHFEKTEDEKDDRM